MNSISEKTDTQGGQFRIAYQNARGLNGKTLEFFHSVLSTEAEYDAVAISESWLPNDVYNSELFPESFTVLKSRNRSETKRGGGVLLAVKNKYKCSLLKLEYNEPGIDLLGIKVQLNNVDFMYILVVYLTPSSNLSERENLFVYIESLQCLYQRKIVLVGDVNIRHLNEYYVNKFRDQQIDIFFNFMEFFDCQQFNKIMNKNKHILDVVVSNMVCKVCESEFSFVEVDKHHPPLMLEIDIKTSKIKGLIGYNNSHNYNFRKADFGAMYQLFQSTSWNDLEDFKNVNEAVKYFYKKLFTIFDTCVPKRKYSSKVYPVYFTKNIINSIKNKEKLRMRVKKTNNIEMQNQLRELRANIKKDIKTAHKNYLNKIQQDITHDSRSFWRYVNDKRSVIGVPNIMHFNGEQYSDGKSISNAFAAYFGSVFVGDTNSAAGHDIVNDCQSFDVFCLNRIKYEDVCDAVGNLKINKAVGPDGVPSYLYKGMIGFLAEPLRVLFNLSLKTNTFPEIWKEAKICPVFKKDDISDVKNYRPISLLSCPAKIFESVIYKFVYNSVKNKISTRQHGFQNNKSTCTNLCEITQYIAESLDKRYQVDIIYMDFAKAFDRVSHDILIQKLFYKFSFNDDLVNFFKSYLHNRPQRVVVRGHYSDYYYASSGIPQGSNLGPLLFLLFINDLVDKIDHKKVLLFADDLKLYTKISCQMDSNIIQQSLNIIYEWSYDNKLELNISKCFVLSFSRKRAVFEYEYKINGQILVRVEKMRDLGVTFDTQLNFKNHIYDITGRASRMYGFIVRNCKEMNVLCIKTLYVAYVRSILEYCSIVWSPCYENQKYSIERIQNKFLRYINYKETGIYDLHIQKKNIMRSHNLQTLDNRRKVSSISFLYKLMNNMINSPDLLNQINIYAPVYRTRNPISLYIDKRRTNYYNNSPVINMCRLYNQIRLQFDIWNLCPINKVKSVLYDILE